ncbi:MAG: MotA/TolQ/ExbB proton channel family protein [Planctomycetota bacterium]|nr:MotA/TolQ/ExbB proton channel family protein [Planctomycetota bacterium]
MATYTSQQQPPRWPYLGALATLVVAVSLPIGLMIFNPTLMFERGWEQYAGTSLFVFALATLSGRLLHFWREEHGLIAAGQRLRTQVNAVSAGRISVGIPRSSTEKSNESKSIGEWSISERRLEQLLSASKSVGLGEFQQVMELNREQSGLDQEHEAGRFALSRYILYLLPVIGFIGTVEGISKALANISKVLPMVKDLDGFMNNLTSVTSALQIAFDSTLLALFLSATLMFVQTIMLRRAEDLLARIDRWVVDQALVPLTSTTKLSAENTHEDEVLEERWDALLQSIDEIARALGVGLGPQTERLQVAVDRLASGLSGLDSATQRLAEAGTAGQHFSKLAEASLRSGMALERIEANVEGLAHRTKGDSVLESVRQSVERTTSAVESLSTQFTQSFERSSRQSQENLTRTLGSLKDAIEMINVSIEQGNTLYRGIVRTMFDQRERESDAFRKVG